VISPPRIEGVFTSAKQSKITFEWNPNKIFKYPIKATLLLSHFPSVIFDAPISLLFSLHPPPRNAVDRTAYPFPKGILVIEAKTVAVELPIDVPPLDFLREVHSSTNPDPFHVSIGIGLPDNDVFPTLSFSDFYSLSASNNLRWGPIFEHLKSKYLPLKGTEGVQGTFFDYLARCGDNSVGTKSIPHGGGVLMSAQLRLCLSLSSPTLSFTFLFVHVLTPSPALRMSASLTPLSLGTDFTEWLRKLFCLMG
jgi:hypothetical protein